MFLTHTRPQGDYVLNLERSEHRKLARMLACLVAHEPDFSWVDGTYNGFPFDFAYFMDQEGTENRACYNDNNNCTSKGHS